MNRPIGVILLAGAAGLAALYQLYQMLIYMGIVDFTLLGKAVSYPDVQWGAALWTLLIAAIWIWVALGFWNLRLYAVRFGLFISLFVLIWGFFSLLFGSSVEAQTVPWLLAGFIYLYLSYPGVQQHFVANEMSKLTPEQVAAMDALDAANVAAGTPPAPGMGTPPEAPAAAPAKKDDSAS
jgi:hypothetical protein